MWKYRSFNWNTPNNYHNYFKPMTSNVAYYYAFVVVVTCLSFWRNTSQKRERPTFTSNSYKDKQILSFQPVCLARSFTWIMYECYEFRQKWTFLYAPREKRNYSYSSSILSHSEFVHLQSIFPFNINMNLEGFCVYSFRTTLKELSAAERDALFNYIIAVWCKEAPTHRT